MDNRCDICHVIVPAIPIDEPQEAYSLVNHKWVEHGILGITRCEHCGAPCKTDSLADHLAIEHDLSRQVSDGERIRRELVRLRRTILEATELVAERPPSELVTAPESEIAKAVQRFTRGAMWLVGFAAVGYVVNGFQGTAVAVILLLVVVIIAGFVLK